MAGRSTKAPAGKDGQVLYEADTLYRVRLNRIVAMPGDPDTKLSPAHGNMLKGKVLAHLDPEAVADVEPV